jgi:hypothetical protein
MALDSYANLKTAVAAWLNRTDLTATVPDFITLCEVQMGKELRCQNMMVRAQATISHEYEDLPSDYLEMITIQIPSSGSAPPIPLEYVSTQNFNERVFSFSPGQPQVYTVIGSQIRFGPAPSSDTLVEMGYFAQIPSLSSTNASNWLLVQAPEIYLYGSLTQSAPFMRDDGRMGTWAQLYETGVSSLNDSSNAATHAAGPLRSRSNIAQLGGQPMNR